jgi:hypothetical protein
MRYSNTPQMTLQCGICKIEMSLQLTAVGNSTPNQTYRRGYRRLMRTALAKSANNAVLLMALCITRRNSSTHGVKEMIDSKLHQNRREQIWTT